MYDWSLIFLEQQPASNPAVGFILPLAIVAIFYLLVFRPMQRQKKEQQKMLTGLQNGNTVLTSGGIVGTIVGMNDDDTLVLRVKPDNIKLQVARSAITSLVNEQSGKK